MKKTLLIIAISAAAGTAFAQEFSAPLRRGPEVTKPPYSYRIFREGGIQRAARMGNVAQAINPFAPREYGTGAEFVEYRGEDPFFRPRDASRNHPIALRLFAFEF